MTIDSSSSSSSSSLITIYTNSWRPSSTRIHLKDAFKNLPFSQKPSKKFTKTRVLFLAPTISASVVIFCSILYFLYHLWNSLVHRAKTTIPFDASAPRVLFLAPTISASVVIFCSILYFLYHLWNSLVHRAKTTIPFDASAPLKLQRFSYKDLKQATNGFDTANHV